MPTISLHEKPIRSTFHRFQNFAIAGFILTAILSYYGINTVIGNSESCTHKLRKLPENPFLSIKPLRPEDASKGEYFLNDPDFRELSLKRYVGAIQIPTQVFDFAERPEKNITGWEPFLELHKYWEKTFPQIHKHLKVEKINELGLIITYEGSDPDLAPLLFLAHQDVVPVDDETLDSWTYPPFSGHYDGEFVWGRGALDTKNLLVGTLEALEELVKEGYKPKRTIVYSLGYDEEAIGRYDGAVSLSKFLQDRYGAKSFYALVDEGGSAIKAYGSWFAVPSVAEKGYLDTYIQLDVPGGHSSRPPDHSGIGIIGDLAVSIESDPYPSVLTDDNPLLDFLNTFGEVALDLDEELKNDFILAKYDKTARAKVLKLLEKDELSAKYLIRTSQALDIVKGGVKINALPEITTLGINHRISLELTAQDAIDNVVSHVKTIAEKYGLGLKLETSNVTVLEATDKGTFNVFWVQPLDPSPISPTKGKKWDVFASTIKHVFDDLVFASTNETVTVAPNLVGGYTDASRYVPLTDHVYRFIASYNDLNGGAHAIDEHFYFDAHLSTVAFVYDYILNVNEYDS